MVRYSGNGESHFRRRPRVGRQRGRLQRPVALVAMLLPPLALVGLGWMVVQALGHSDFFQVTEIEIEGCRRLTKEQVLELSGVDIHSNLLALSIPQIEVRVAVHDWVETAKASRQWPSRLRIAIREKTPVALLNRKGVLFYLDRHGRPFAAVTPPDDLDFPVISGWREESVAEAENLTATREALEFLRYAGRGNLNLPAQNISEINIGDREDLVVYLVSRPFPIRLGRGAMKNKYERLAKVLGGLYRRKQFEQVAYIDVDYREGQVLVGSKSS